jgi:hypothetical protein
MLGLEDFILFTRIGYPIALRKFSDLILRRHVLLCFPSCLFQLLSASVMLSFAADF